MFLLDLKCLYFQPVPDVTREIGRCTEGSIFQVFSDCHSFYRSEGTETIIVVFVALPNVTKERLDIPECLQYSALAYRAPRISKLDHF